MKISKLAEAMMWLPGFAPSEDPFEVLGIAGEPREESAAPLWPRLEPSVFADLAGDVTKFEANLAAIELLRELESAKRQPNAEERVVLNRYTGWGGLPQAFNLDQKEVKWAERAAHLKGVLGETVHASAEASTPNAHYTSLEIIEAMWAMVERLGFKGGRILEPSAGTGYFLGAMPAEIARNSKVMAVELDALSANILRSLYEPFGVQVEQNGFERLSLPRDYFDLAISNVPFGNYRVPELRNVPYRDFMIHDYFFAKALEVVRPGGLVAFITSSGTMDKFDDTVRQYLGSRAALVAAIRLPNTAFKKIANTEVTTDIVILQKPLTGKPSNREWMKVKSLDSVSPIYGGPKWTSTPVYANQHYVENTQWVIGKLSLCSNGYSKSTGCIFEGDLSVELADKTRLLPEGVYTSQQEDLDSGKVVKLALTEQHRPGFRLIDGRVYEVIGSEAVLYSAPHKTLDRIAAMIEIRDDARKLLRTQAETEDPQILAVYRQALNIAYDGFLFRYGYINAKANRQAFRSDPDLPLLLALERWDEATQTAEKADIFDRNTVGAYRRVERCSTAREALVACVGEKGFVSEQRIGQLLGRLGADAMAELESEGAVFMDPNKGRWETADAYLSGNVRHKLTLAKLAGIRYQRNVTALESVIPADLSPSEIGARVGSTWIPISDYEAFLNETLECNNNRIEFSETAGAWSLEPAWNAKYSIAATQAYGTSRVNATELFEQALNQMVPTVSDPNPRNRDKRVVNQKETIAAREKQQLLKERFAEWLWSDEARAQRLVRLYNDQFNAVAPRNFDGGHLALPGFSQVYRLRKHQQDAIWRIVASGVSTLLAHHVGAGKTLTMICAGMELRRIGKASKPMFVVPNHMLAQFAAEFMRAYPGANILMAGKDDLQGDKRRVLMSRIATGDWDGVLVTHASFERIPMSGAFMKGYIEGEIDDISDAIRAAKNDRGNRITKELARAKKTWEAKLAKLSGKSKKDDLLFFEDLGIDWLFVDEAHLAKNLWRFTKMTRIAGLPNSNSERAFDMFVKTRHVMEKHSGVSGITFATGTPVSNSMAEMWVMQRYLQPLTLDARSMGMFDVWAANFGESVTALELSPDGSGYRMQTRFAKFVNLPELMSLFGEVADIRTAEMLNLPVPRVRKETITAPNTPDLRVFVQSLVERAEAIRTGDVMPSEDNMLSVTNDGRKAALDIRLVWGDSFHLDMENSKVSLCARKVHEVWQETTRVRGAQLVFCDQSTPHNDGRFSVYSNLRLKLVEMGVPATEIAFIHDYDSDSAKEELFKSVRDGRVRVLLGSTSKMGVGTNVQTRLVALHHLDAPWRPADVEQREGRIVRQGNLNEEVRIFRYVTEGSFDSYIWQTLETKARFIAQVMRGDTGMRSAEDVELAALSYAEVKALASGNPLVLEKAGVDTELAKLTLLRSQWDQQQWQNRRELANLPARIGRIKERIEAIGKDVAARVSTKGDNFAMEVMGSRYRDRTAAGKALLQAWQGTKQGSRTIGRIAGFRVVVKTSDLAHNKRLMLAGNTEYEAGKSDSPTGLVRVLENTLERMEEQLASEREHLTRTEKRLDGIQAELAKPFEKAERLSWLRERQREIESMLDLTKGEMAAADEAEVAEAA